MAVGRRVIGTLAVRGISITAQLGLFVLIARSTDLHTVGTFAVAGSVWVLTRALLPMGWNIALLKRTSVLLETGSGRAAFTLLVRAVTETVVVGVLLAAIIAVTLLLLDIEQLLLWLVVAAVGLAWAIVGILVGYLRAHGYLLTSQFFDGVVIYVIPLVICGVTALLYPLDLLVVVGSHLVSSLVALICLFALVLFLRRQDRISAPSALHMKTERQLARRLWWNQVFSALSSRAPVLLTAPLAGVSSTAIVETGLRTQLVGATLAWAGGTVASPRYAVAHHHGRSEGALILSAVTWATMLPTALVAAVLWVWGEPILQLLGDAYAEESLAVTIMATAAVAELPAACGGYFLMMTGREKISSISTLSQLVVLCVTALFLGPQFGALGIALAVLVSACCRTSVVLIGLRLHHLPAQLSLPGLRFLADVLVRGIRHR